MGCPPSLRVRGVHACLLAAYAESAGGRTRVMMRKEPQLKGRWRDRDWGPKAITENHFFVILDLVGSE